MPAHWNARIRIQQSTTKTSAKYPSNTQQTTKHIDIQDTHTAGHTPSNIQSSHAQHILSDILFFAIIQEKHKEAAVRQAGNTTHNTQSSTNNPKLVFCRQLYPLQKLWMKMMMMTTTAAAAKQKQQQPYKTFPEVCYSVCLPACLFALLLYGVIPFPRPPPSTPFRSGGYSPSMNKEPCLVEWWWWLYLQFHHHQFIHTDNSGREPT